jgi:hypothetical protein
MGEESSCFCGIYLTSELGKKGVPLKRCLGAVRYIMNHINLYCYHSANKNNVAIHSKDRKLKDSASGLILIFLSNSKLRHLWMKMVVFQNK